MQGFGSLWRVLPFSGTKRQVALYLTDDPPSDNFAVIRLKGACIFLIHGVYGVLPVDATCISRSKLLEEMLSSSDMSTETFVPMSEDTFASWMAVVGDTSFEQTPGDVNSMPRTMSNMIQLLLVCLSLKNLHVMNCLPMP